MDPKTECYNEVPVYVDSEHFNSATCFNLEFLIYLRVLTNLVGVALYSKVDLKVKIHAIKY